MGENTKYPFLLGFCILEPSCCKGHLGEEHKIFWTSVHLCLQAYLALRNCLVEELRDFSILIQAHYQFSFCRSKRNSVFQKGTLSSCKCYRCDFLKGKVGQTERYHYQFSLCKSKRNFVFRKGKSYRVISQKERCILSRPIDMDHLKVL